MTKSDKILTSEYLDWHAKLNDLPSILTDKIRSNLYKKYKNETGHEPWQLSKAVIMSAKPQASDFKPITKPDPELIIKSVLDRGTHYAMENMGIMDYMTKYCKACSDVTDIYQPVIAAGFSREPTGLVHVFIDNSNVYIQRKNLLAKRGIK
ncbi:unnamed protein product [Rhizophagus irregularis]|nr:unnamed protein product [Rhizophagus irregularis]